MSGHRRKKHSRLALSSARSSPRWAASTRPDSSATNAAPYFVVQRTIGGEPAYYIERLHDREFTDVRDCFFVDSGLSYDAPIEILFVTEAFPVVVTTTNSHGLSDGDEVDVSDIVWEPDVDSVYNETQPDQLNGKRYFVGRFTT